MRYEHVTNLVDMFLIEVGTSSMVLCIPLGGGCMYALGVVALLHLLLELGLDNHKGCDILGQEISAAAVLLMFQAIACTSDAGLDTEGTLCSGSQDPFNIHPGLWMMDTSWSMLF